MTGLIENSLRKTDFFFKGFPYLGYDFTKKMQQKLEIGQNSKCLEQHFMQGKNILHRQCTLGRVIVFQISFRKRLWFISMYFDILERIR